MFKHQIEQLKNVNMIIFSNIQIKMIWSSILGTLTYLTGCETRILEAIAVLILIDTLFGVMVAIKKKRLQSWSFLMLALLKIMIYLCLIIGIYQAVILGFPAWFKDLIIFLIATTEVISILENSSILGFKWARKVVDKINSEVEQKINK
jgi:toxin secretion/phage lysis holin